MEQAFLMNGNAKYHFDEEGTRTLVLEWQKTKCDRVLEKIFKNADCMIRALIFSRGIYQHMEAAEIISLIQFKIWRGLHLYSPCRGRLYSFLTRVIHNRITQAQIDTSKKPVHESLDEEQWENIAKCNPEGSEGVEEIAHKIMRTETICTDEKEIEAQRWLVKSFIASGFDIKRHVAANAMTRVYGITKERSRQLHDYTLLEVRRAIIKDVIPPDISVGDLCGTRQKALKKYASELDSEEFSRLIFMMKNLSTTIIDDVYHVLYGFPGSKPLFMDFSG